MLQRSGTWLVGLQAFALSLFGLIPEFKTFKAIKQDWKDDCKVKEAFVGGCHASDPIAKGACCP